MGILGSLTRSPISALSEKSGAMSSLGDRDVPSPQWLATPLHDICRFRYLPTGRYVLSICISLHVTINERSFFYEFMLVFANASYPPASLGSAIAKDI